MATPPLKLAQSAEHHINLLRERGMEVDENQAMQWLYAVGYFRLSAYWYTARVKDPVTGERADRFESGTKFSDVVALYEADRKLRTLIHDGVERVEVALRTRITELLCSKEPEDPTLYLRSEYFKPKFDHVGWLYTVFGRLSRSKSNAVAHYSKNYAGQFPLWVVAEVIDFSDLSRLFSGLGSKDQQCIAESLGVFIDFEGLSENKKRRVMKSHPLASWLEQMSIVRNTCAHHARVWNETFVPASTTLRRDGNLTLLPPTSRNDSQNQSERVFGTLVFMAHLLRRISPGTTWPEKIASLLKDSFVPNPLVSLESMGIPDQWDQRTV